MLIAHIAGSEVPHAANHNQTSHDMRPCVIQFEGSTVQTLFCDGELTSWITLEDGNTQ